MEVMSNTSPEKKVIRPLADFPSDVWGDYFISSAFSRSTLEDCKPRIEELKKQVKEMFSSQCHLAKELRFIDDLQRLGLGYHFEDELKESLKRILEDDLNDGSDSLEIVALRFRLLRQQGYNVSSDVFKRFLDKEEKFEEELMSSGDVKCLLLRLYEASLLATPEEKILHEAFGFSKAKMEQLIKENKDASSTIDLELALDRPFWRGMRRLEVRKYIEKYHEDERSDPVLLDLAKLDFNAVQTLHQSEIKALSIWWKELGLSKELFFSRERIVECYFWSLGVNWEPQYSHGRMLLAKFIDFLAVTDDLFDAYGTLEELQLMNDIIQRGDVQDTNILPNNMKAYVNFLRCIFKEIEDELLKNGRPYQRPYLMESFKEFVGAYFTEAKWANKGYMPNLKEYLDVSVISSGYPLLFCTTPMVNGENVIEDGLKFILKVPNLLKASANIARLMDDLVSYKFEQQRLHVASVVRCYMNEYQATEEEACVMLNQMVSNAWQEINKELLDSVVPFKKYFNMLAIDFTRVIEVIYKHEDAFTNPSGEMKNNISSLLIYRIET